MKIRVRDANVLLAIFLGAGTIWYWAVGDEWQFTAFLCVVNMLVAIYDAVVDP